MPAERPYSRYTRDKTWQALYSQSVNACYALVPNSATNNSIWLVRCKTPAETQERMRVMLDYEQECAAFIAGVLLAEKLPDELAYLAHAGEAVVLAKSSDYWRYHLADDRPRLALVVAGLHDSYLHLPVWETRSNRRYAARETAIKIEQIEQKRGKGKQLAHNILVAAVAAGDLSALAVLAKLPDRTRRRIRSEAEMLQADRYRGRPLAFQSEDKRREVGEKIRAGLLLYHARRHAG